MKKEQIKNKQDKEREDYLANRVMLVFAAAVLLLGGLSYLWKCLDMAGTFLAALKTVEILIWVSAAGLVGGLIWIVSDIKNNRIKEDKVINGVIVTLFFLVLFGSMLLTRYSYSAAKRVLYVVIPAIAILHLIYCSYQREFFSLCLTHSAVCYGLWLIAKTSNRSLALAAAAAAVIICGLALVFFFAAKKNHGVLSIGSFKARIFDNEEISSKAVCAVYIATAALAVAAFFLGAPYAYYILYAMAAFVTVEAIYFTVKLI